MPEDAKSHAEVSAGLDNNLWERALHKVGENYLH